MWSFTNFLKKYGHVLPIAVMIPGFIYLVYVNVVMASKQVTVKDRDADYSYYFISVDSSPQIEALAKRLQTVQGCLDYVTDIPYKINSYHAHGPLDTIRRNYGDCDDKSNLLSSLLSSLGYENYIVLVPNHAFVIVHLEEKIPGKKALYLDGKPFYILESTASGSTIGFELKYKVSSIEAVVDPRSKSLLDIRDIKYY